MAASVTLPPPGPAREFYCRVSPGRPPPDTPTDRAHRKNQARRTALTPARHCSPLLATVASVAEAAAHPHARVAARLRTAPAGLEPTTKTSPTRTLHQLGHAPGSITICNAHETGRS